MNEKELKELVEKATKAAENAMLFATIALVCALINGALLLYRYLDS